MKANLSHTISDADHLFDHLPDFQPSVEWKNDLLKVIENKSRSDKNKVKLYTTLVVILCINTLAATLFFSKDTAISSEKSNHMQQIANELFITSNFN